MPKSRDSPSFRHRRYRKQTLVPTAKDFAPFVWILAVPAEAKSAHEGVIQHFWDHSLSRWRRLPLSHINTNGSITNYDIDEFQKLTGKIWKLKGQRTLKTLNFISHHATASLFHLAEEQRQQNLTTFINWETHRIQAGLTGLDSNLHEFFQSDRNDIFLKQFWAIVLPSLHHHFLCRNPACKKVVNVAPLGHHTQPQCQATRAIFMPMSCLAIYRLFAPQDHKGNKLLKPKQCLVVKASGPCLDLDINLARSLQHRDRPEFHYYLYLMEWPEDATDDLLSTLKVQTERQILWLQLSALKRDFWQTTPDLTRAFAGQSTRLYCFPTSTKFAWRCSKTP